VTTSILPLAETDTVTTHVCREHALLNALLRDVCDDVEAARLDAARSGCEAFERRLRRHLRVEESLLFPLFEARLGIVGGPTATLRQEHREMERTVALMCEALGRGDLDAFEDSLRFLRTTLGQHYSKEEHVLFPTTDAALTDGERRAAGERLRREQRAPGAEGQPAA
jgi:hemerythrin-like domain-containing protein